jgi:hypothetical protein
VEHYKRIETNYLCWSCTDDNPPVGEFILAPREYRVLKVETLNYTAEDRPFIFIVLEEV